MVTTPLATVPLVTTPLVARLSLVRTEWLVIPAGLVPVRIRPVSSLVVVVMVVVAAAAVAGVAEEEEEVAEAAVADRSRPGRRTAGVPPPAKCSEAEPGRARWRAAPDQGWG